MCNFSKLAVALGLEVHVSCLFLQIICGFEFGCLEGWEETPGPQVCTEATPMQCAWIPRTRGNTLSRPIPITPQCGICV